MTRHQFLGTVAMATASTFFARVASAAPATQPVIKAIAFDAFAIFDVRSAYRLLEELFPGRGTALSEQWRTHQFEYTWLRNSMNRYTDFWQVTKDALNYAAKQSGVIMTPAQQRQVMSEYLQLKPWPDVPPVLEMLRNRGLRLALLTNWTPAMMQACTQLAGLEKAFDFQLSTDRVRAYKPDPAAYRMGRDAFHLPTLEIAFVAFAGWDAVGARAFGYPTYWTNRLSLPPEELGVSADKTYPDLSRLLAFITSQGK
jgi:2-haloacid dehalogenase